MNQPLINSMLLSLFGAALGVLTTWFWNKRNAHTKEEEAIREATAALLSRIIDLEKRASLVDQAVVPITAAFHAVLVKQLTHFHTPVVDELLVKLGPPNTLTDDEEKELITALKKRETEVHDQIDASERNAARMLPLLMERMKLEEKDPEKIFVVVANNLPKGETLNESQNLV